ncbi:MAG: hypothetical protein K1X78_13400 [Verrucomicrobiaceae bacterium]|nr:hypothetical protein [Verrucomicrobiaceae bacterium]
MTPAPDIATEPERDAPPSFVRGLDLESSEYYRGVGRRAEESEAVMRKVQAEMEAEPGGFAKMITRELEDLLALGRLDGLTIASSDGLVIAEASRLPNGDIMAAIGAVFEYVAERAQHAGIVSGVDEMTLLGTNGGLAVVRYFPRLDRRFFLVAYARERCTYRRITGLVLKRCGRLLEKKFGHF